MTISSSDMCLGVTQISKHKENKISLIAADGVFCFDFQFSSKVGVMTLLNLINN